MPRLARLDAPGVLHHIIIRGIERRKIFRDDEDKNNFTDRLSILLPEIQTTCYAWALLSNHAHFLFRSGSAGISTLMRRLLTGYAIYFNRKYRRHGQLFQNRYKSIICQEDIYFKELVRYIHYNNIIRTAANTIGAVMADFFNTTVFENWDTLSEDGNHPNAAGYDRITNIWYLVISGTL